MDTGIDYRLAREDDVPGISTVFADAIDRFMESVLGTALELVAAQGVDRVSYWTPGSNVHAVDVALGHRMRFEPFVFMCTKPFARWESYMFHSAALM